MTDHRPMVGILLAMAIAVGACSESETGEAPDPAPTVTQTTTTQPTTTTTEPPQTATLTIDTVVDDDGGGGSFTAGGSAVETGRFCAEGAFSNLDFDFDADPMWFEDSYRCEGIDGRLVIRVESPSTDEPPDGEERQDVVGTWIVASATGDWEGTTGGGSYRASFDPWVEAYAGNLDFG